MLEDIKVWLIGAVVVGSVIPMLVKWSVGWIKKNLGEQLHIGLALESIKDPILRAKLQKVSLAVVEVVEYVTPGRGKGVEKFAKADALMASIPLLAALPALRKALIEWACQMLWAADETLQDEIKEHQPIPADEVPPVPPQP